MKSITIAERVRPFSHTPGIEAMVPASGFSCQVFPCLLRLFDLQRGAPYLIQELVFSFVGPIEQFTVLADHEKGQLTVFGKTAKGWMRYHLVQEASLLKLIVEKAPEEGVFLQAGEERKMLMPKEEIILVDKSLSGQLPVARLSLGVQKKQEWEGIKQRLLLAEIFPLLHRAGACVPPVSSPKEREGTLLLLDKCRQAMEGGKPEEGEALWKAFLAASFSGLFVPRLCDEDHLGLVPPASKAAEEMSLLTLLSEASRLIVQQFVRQEERQLFILPYLLPSLHAGRLIDLPLEGGAHLSIEWSKKTIRRLELRAEASGEWQLHFRSSIKTCRVSCKGQRQRKEQIVTPSLPLHCEVGHIYFLDNFQK